MQKVSVAFMLHLFSFSSAKHLNTAQGLLFRILQNETKSSCQLDEANDLNLPFLHRLCWVISCFVVLS